MSYSQTPNEILDRILIFAVRVRGATRAARVRLVSRRWDAATEYAMFYSGILADPKCASRADRSDPRTDLSFWQRCLTFRVLQGDRPLSIHLELILRVAVFVVETRKTDANGGDTNPSVKDLICCTSFCYRVLTREIIAVDITKLKSNAFAMGSCCLPNPWRTSVYFGSTKAISWLLDHVPHSQSQKQDISGKIIGWAMSGNQEEVLELVLGSTFTAESPDFERWRSILVVGLLTTTSVHIFRRCFALVEGHLINFNKPGSKEYQARWLRERFSHAAQNGAVALMEYLFQRGVTGDLRLFNDLTRFSFDAAFMLPMYQAATHGHMEAVKWWLDKGEPAASSLPAAVICGSERMVQLLIEYKALEDHVMAQKAFLVATEREDESLFRLLVTHGAWPDKSTIARALELTKEKQLDSMQGFLLNYLAKPDE
ncbi:hypothetical protein F5Y18DRAFT_428440 [Xylariaceae sp. FL1019]|nr:hypothetical protein F5Y18DRAFT_428440 [Xylariaceae sp. FL1019]